MAKRKKPENWARVTIEERDGVCHVWEGTIVECGERGPLYENFNVWGGKETEGPRMRLEMKVWPEKPKKLTKQQQAEEAAALLRWQQALRQTELAELQAEKQRQRDAIIDTSERIAALEKELDDE